MAFWLAAVLSVNQMSALKIVVLGLIRENRFIYLCTSTFSGLIHSSQTVHLEINLHLAARSIFIRAGSLKWGTTSQDYTKMKMKIIIL